MKGTVKFFDKVKGFGFITGEDGKDYFVHQSAMGEDVKLYENDAVVFDAETSDRGPKAVNVQKDEGGSEESASEEAANDDEVEESGDEEAA